MQNTLKRKYKSFIIPIVVFFLALIATFGIAYLQTATSRGSSIFRESEKIRARNLAQAGLEKALLFIQRKYSFGEYEVHYPSGKFVTSGFDKEMNMKIGGVGNYQVVSIKPYSFQKGIFSVTDFNQVPYIKDKRVIGKYDIWEIESLGTTEFGIGATMNTLVKVIRQDIVY